MNINWQKIGCRSKEGSKCVPRAIAKTYFWPFPDFRFLKNLKTNYTKKNVLLPALSCFDAKANASMQAVAALAQGDACVTCDSWVSDRQTDGRTDGRTMFQLLAAR